MIDFISVPKVAFFRHSSIFSLSRWPTIQHVSEPVAGIAGELAGAVSAGAGEAATPFSDLLTEAITRVEGYRVTADQTVNRFVRGGEEEVHKVAIAAQQSELAFELFLQVKNKVVQAYQEVMRMQL